MYDIGSLELHECSEGKRCSKRQLEGRVPAESGQDPGRLDALSQSQHAQKVNAVASCHLLCHEPLVLFHWNERRLTWTSTIDTPVSKTSVLLKMLTITPARKPGTRIPVRLVSRRPIHQGQVDAEFPFSLTGETPSRQLPDDLGIQPVLVRALVHHARRRRERGRPGIRQSIKARRSLPASEVQAGREDEAGRDGVAPEGTAAERYGCHSACVW